MNNDLQQGDERFRGMMPDDALMRASGAALVSGNRLRILRDGRENYPAWEAALASARSTIHLEMYVIHDDRTGRHFRDILVQKASEGVRIRVLYDWFGARSIFVPSLWKPLIAAGGEIRVANPPTLSSLLGWVSRDHRKLLTVDGTIAFVSGLCIGDAWSGTAQNGIQPWRDTGVMIEGPAVAEVERAFFDAWCLAGGSKPEGEPIAVPEQGSVAMRVVATTPETAGLYRLDLMIAAAAQEYLWLTDAYFLGTGAYIQALRAAALDGVDVRLLLPHGSDVQWIANFSRTSYRTLLEAGVRVFEWNGQMIHAKTAVCDGLWARIGSSNLNLSSWLGNWELDVVIENEEVASSVGEMFLEDLENATEVVITSRNKIRPVHNPPRSPRGRVLRSSGQSVLLRAVSAGSALNAAVTGKRKLSRAESSSLLSFALVLMALTLVAVIVPTFFSYALAILFGLAALTLFIRAMRLRNRKDEEDGEEPDQ
ncbi:MAG TPA: phospholipase D-like domain-containing protein [Dissulfurispiraceae bacterium]|nr:phospholipase D-like domain-containing protein [Dissulfurispiraceae bacterium]